MPTETTLYQRWREVATEHRSEWALHEAATGTRWTFAQLADAADRAPACGDPVAFPQGTQSGFVLEVLRAWREGRLVCPLEPGQSPPPGPWPAPPIAHLKLTSATTGRPRRIAFTAHQIAADAAQIVATMGLRPDWPNVAVVSLAHSYGFSNLVTPLLLHGIPLLLAGSGLPEAMRRAAAAAPAVTLPAVPALWRAWHEAEAIPAGVRLAISAGAPLPVLLERDVFDRTGLKIHNFYGASECGGIAYDRTATPRADGSHVGTAVDGVRLAVHPDGCLEVRGPGVALGYWPESEPTLGAGLHRTSDLAELRGDDVLLLGRAVDVINVAGRKVAPETIERVLLEHPDVREALVLGLPASGGREEAIASVIVPNGTASEATLREFLLARLPAWQVPRRWHFEGSSLADGRGKTARARWRETLSGP